MVETLPEEEGFENAAFIQVGNTLDALQNLAAHIRLAFPGEVAAITGSNGKTIIKEWIYQVLNKAVPMVRSPLSYNSQVGVPAFAVSSRGPLPAGCH